jgi:hypothetical protein
MIKSPPRTIAELAVAVLRVTSSHGGRPTCSAVVQTVRRLFPLRAGASDEFRVEFMFRRAQILRECFRLLEEANS